MDKIKDMTRSVQDCVSFNKTERDEDQTKAGREPFEQMKQNRLLDHKEHQDRLSLVES